MCKILYRNPFINFCLPPVAIEKSNNHTRPTGGEEEAFDLCTLACVLDFSEFSKTLVEGAWDFPGYVVLLSKQKMANIS